MTEEGSAALDVAAGSVSQAVTKLKQDLSVSKVPLGWREAPFGPLVSPSHSLRRVVNTEELVGTVMFLCFHSRDSPIFRLRILSPQAFSGNSFTRTECFSPKWRLAIDLRHFHAHEPMGWGQ